MFLFCQFYFCGASAVWRPPSRWQYPRSVGRMVAAWRLATGGTWPWWPAAPTPAPASSPGGPGTPGTQPPHRSGSHGFHFEYSINTQKAPTVAFFWSLINIFDEWGFLKLSCLHLTFGNLCLFQKRNWWRDNMWRSVPSPCWRQLV